MGQVVLRTRDPALAAIKLAWWREALQALDQAPPPPEPRLQAVASELLPRQISGERLSAIEDGWLALLDAAPDPALVAQRGANVFDLAASLLGYDGSRLTEHGRIWALADLARRTGELSWLERPNGRIPATSRKLRPITALTVLALRDHRKGKLEPDGSPARAWALLRHRFTGRY